jgi:hairy and enhancer of split related with YRPW motif
MDYHIIGFRECASEVARYLVTIEGMDIQDPLRLRLMSHLQCFVAQRELSAKSSASGTSTYPPYQPNYTNQGYQNYPAASAPITPHQQSNQSMFMHNSSYVGSSGSSLSYLNSTLPHSPEYSSSGYSTLSSSTASSVNATLNSTSAATTAASTTQNADQPTEESQQPIYTDLTSNTNDRLMGNYSYANQLAGSGHQYNYNNNNNNSKPYRPWHPEMAY